MGDGDESDVGTGGSPGATSMCCAGTVIMDMVKFSVLTIYPWTRI